MPGGPYRGDCTGGTVPGGTYRVTVLFIVWGDFGLGGFWLGGILTGGILSGGILARGDFVLGGFCPGGSCPGGFCPGGFCLGGFCPVTIIYIEIRLRIQLG